jgi:uncharacterized protein YjbI with pentapeptide repeats
MSATLRRTVGDVIGQGASVKAIAEANEADLCGANLRKADLREANLRKADLRHANLREANLREANLRGADLRGADLRHANLREANLCGADLRGADLRRADLRGADLRGANLRGATMAPPVHDARGHTFYATWSHDDPSPIIRAGCRRWSSFADARAHYRPGYSSDGDTAECLAILDFIEARHRALTAKGEGRP